MKGEVALTIDGKPISKEYLDAMTSQIPAKQLEMMKSSGQFKEFVEQMGMAQQLYDKAIAEKMHEDPKIQFKIAIAERDALIKEYMNKVSTSAVTPEALQAKYTEREAQYKRAQVKVAHILVKDQAEADALLAQLKGGGDFAAVAKEKSQDRGSAQKGGDLNWIAQGQISKEFSDAAFAAPLNEIVGPVQDRLGFHLLRVSEKRDAIPLEEVKDQLEGVIKQDAVKKLLEDIKANAKIEWKIDAGGPPAGAAPAGMPGAPGAPTIQLSPGPKGPPPSGTAAPAGAPAAPPAPPAGGAPPAAPPPAAPPAPAPH
jgi:peptidyl-prolyl cis-trans isomerase C